MQKQITDAQIFHKFEWYHTSYIHTHNYDLFYEDGDHKFSVHKLHKAKATTIVVKDNTVS